jgi:hypothetical protein
MGRRMVDVAIEREAVLDNSCSAGETNFRDYVQTTYGLGAPLPPNIELTGKRT